MSRLQYLFQYPPAVAKKSAIIVHKQQHTGSMHPILTLILTLINAVYHPHYYHPQYYRSSDDIGDYYTRVFGRHICSVSVNSITVNLRIDGILITSIKLRDDLANKFIPSISPIVEEHVKSVLAYYLSHCTDE